MIRIERATKIYRDAETGNSTVAFRNLNLHLEPGQLCFLRGSSGCGKTTLLRMLLGELKADDGHVYVNGKDVAQISKKQLPIYRRSLGVVFQDYRLIGDMTVYENVAMPRLAAGASGKTLPTYVSRALKQVGMDGYFKRRPKDLSGGEQQRVAIARALAGEPAIILADEPTGNLDPANSKAIMELLAQINKQLGITVVIATHDDEAIREIDGLTFDMEQQRF